MYGQDSGGHLPHHVQQQQQQQQQLYAQLPMLHSPHHEQEQQQAGGGLNDGAVSTIMIPSPTVSSSGPVAAATAAAQAAAAAVVGKRRVRKLGGAKQIPSTPALGAGNAPGVGVGGVGGGAGVGRAPVVVATEKNAQVLAAATAAAVAARQQQYKQQQQLLGSQVATLAESIFRRWGAEGVLREDVVTRVLQHWYLMQNCWGTDRSRGLLEKFMGLTALSEAALKEAALGGGPEAPLQRATQAPTPLPPVHPFLAVLDDWTAAVALHVSDMKEGVERITANGRFEETFMGAKEALERLWGEQLPFAFLLAGLVAPEDRQRLLEELLALTFRSTNALEDRHMVLKCTDRHGLTFLGIVRIRTHRDLVRQYDSTIVSLQPLPLVVPPPPSSGPVLGTSTSSASSSSGSSSSGGPPSPSPPPPKPVLSWRPTRDGGRWRYAELTLAQDTSNRVLVLERWGGGLVRGDGWGLRTLTTGTALYVEGSRVLGVRPPPGEGAAALIAPQQQQQQQEQVPVLPLPQMVQLQPQQRYMPSASPSLLGNSGGVTKRIFPPTSTGASTLPLARQQQQQQQPQQQHQQHQQHQHQQLQQQQQYHPQALASPTPGGASVMFPSPVAHDASAFGSPILSQHQQQQQQQKAYQVLPHQQPQTPFYEPPSTPLLNPPPASFTTQLPPTPSPRGGRGRGRGRGGGRGTSKRARTTPPPVPPPAMLPPAAAPHAEADVGLLSTYAITAAETLAGWAGGEESPAASQALADLLQVSGSLPSTFFEAADGELAQAAAAASSSPVVGGEGESSMPEWQVSALEHEMEHHGHFSPHHSPASPQQQDGHQQHHHHQQQQQQQQQEMMAPPVQQPSIAPMLRKTESTNAAATILMLTGGAGGGEKGAMLERALGGGGGGGAGGGEGMEIEGGGEGIKDEQAKEGHVEDEDDHLHFLQ